MRHFFGAIDADLGEFGEAVLYAAREKWRGSPTFAYSVTRCVLHCRFAGALEMLWYSNDLDLAAVVDDLGGRLCEVDAARARGEGDEAWHRTAEKFFREMWGVGAL